VSGIQGARDFRIVMVKSEFFTFEMWDWNNVIRSRSA